MKMNYMSWMTGLCFSLFTAVNAYAAYPGLYLGIQGGWDNVHDTGISRQDMGTLINAAVGSYNFNFRSFNGTTSGDGPAGRLYVGYQFWLMSALEFGWTELNSIPVKASATIFDNDTSLPGTVSTSGTVKLDAFDLVAKGILPLKYHFNVYGKFGIALLESRSNASASVDEAGTITSGGSISDVTSRIYPTFGVGIAYDFRPDIQMDLSWSRIQKVGDSHELGSVDFVSVGLSFHFDKLCYSCTSSGSFLPASNY